MGASKTAKKARQTSCTWITGRQGFPSLYTVILPVVAAAAMRLLRTVSNRIRGDSPYIVPLRRNVGENPVDARLRMPASARTFERAYSVSGARGDSSLTSKASETPYMMQEDENRKRGIPASRASVARRTEACSLMSVVHSAFRLPIGSLLSAARWI